LLIFPGKVLILAGGGIKMSIVKLLLLLPFLLIFFQLYYYAVTRKGPDRQQACRALGIFSFSVGAACLVSRDTMFVFLGFGLMMAGFRLIAHGLDRLDKKIFIDRYEKAD
jgi:hypothetical protein